MKTNRFCQPLYTSFNQYKNYIVANNKAAALIVAIVTNLLLVSTVLAADLYLVHGADNSNTDEEYSFPVDISINGGCALIFVDYPTFFGPLTFPSGPYIIEVSAADGSCSGKKLSAIDLQLGDTDVIVALMPQQEGLILKSFSKRISSITKTDRKSTEYQNGKPQHDYFRTSL